jgi:hypothetical protein
MPDTDELAETDASSSDDEQLVRWRRRCFLQLGFNRAQARRLAELRADWHAAEALLAAGCPLDLAFDIIS